MCLQPIDLQLQVTYSLAIILRVGMAEVSVRAGLRRRITLWNSYLRTVVQEFREGHSGAIAVIYDVASVFTSVLEHPTNFGFKDSTDWGDENCVWNDALHPTSKMHQIIAEEFVMVIQKEFTAIPEGQRIGAWSATDPHSNSKGHQHNSAK